MQDYTMKPLGIGGILDRSFKMYRDHFGVMVALSLLFSGTANLIAALLTLGDRALSSDSVLAALMSGESVVDSLAAMSGTSAGSSTLSRVLQLVIALLVTPVVSGGITLIAIKLSHGESHTTGEYMQEVKQLFGRFVGTSFCITLITVGIAFVASIVIAIFAIALRSVAMLLILLAVLYAILMPVMALAYPIAVCEGRYFFSWIGRAFTLTFRKFFKCLGVVILTALIVSALSIIINLLPMLLPPIVRTTANVVVVGLLQPISLIAATLLYLDVRIVTEGYDLELRAGAMNQGPGQAQSYGNPYSGQAGAPYNTPYGGQLPPQPYQPPNNSQYPNQGAPYPGQSPAPPHNPGQPQPGAQPPYPPAPGGGYANQPPAAPYQAPNPQSPPPAPQSGVSGAPYTPPPADPNATPPGGPRADE